MFLKKSVAMISIQLEKKEFDTYLLVGHDRNMFFFKIKSVGMIIIELGKNGI